MRAQLKRLLILSVALLFPGVAFSYVSIHTFTVDNLVPVGSEGFVVGIEAEVGPGDTWSSSWFEWEDSASPLYADLCFNHDTYGPGYHQVIFYVPFNDAGQPTALDSDGVELYTYADSDCSNYNVYDVFHEDMITTEWRWLEITSFVVNKEFRPMSDEEIQVDINCTAGSPGDDSTMMDQDGVHIFPQEFLNPSNPNHNCVITEADVPAGYQALYITNPGEREPPELNGVDDSKHENTVHLGLVSREGCFFYGSGNMRSSNSCQIINFGLPSTFTVTKLWEVFQDQDGQFVELDELRVRLGIECTRDINSGHVNDQLDCRDVDGNDNHNGCSFDQGDFGAEHRVNWVVTGDATIEVNVDNTGYDPVECWAYENIYYSNVERSFTDCATFEEGITRFEIAPGGSEGCGFVNTVFFEGIPTLSQYGMALMALLMLGVGFVGFRRFV